MNRIKLSFFAFSLFVVLFDCSAQKIIDSGENQKTLVKIKNWRRVSMFFADVFWEGKKEQLEKQLGPGALDSVKKYSDIRSIPAQLLLFDGHRKLNLDEYARKMDSL